MEPTQLSLPFEPSENEYHIFLDMDGVIVNLQDTLTQSIKKLLSEENKHSKKFWARNPTFETSQLNSQYLSKVFIKKDLGESLSKLEKDIRNISYKPLANNVDLWSNLPAYAGAADFVNFLLDNFKITILSSPVDDDCISGKQEWIQTHFPNVFEKCIFETDKYIHATPNGILVDDRPKNCMKWIEAGGIAIQHIDFETTLEQLQQYL